MVNPPTTLYAPTYVPGMPAPVASAPPPMPASYQGLLDQLHLANQVPAPVMTAPPPVAMPPLQPQSFLGDLWQRLSDLVDRLLPDAPAPAPGGPGKAPRATEFVISSFNVLGSSHTAPGGNKPGMDSGVERIRRAAQLLAQHKVDVVGFQEFQGDQLREFQRVAGDRYAVYPGFQLGRREVVNSIAWRKDQWDLVKPGHIDIPYFDGHRRKMPVVLLRNKETGQEAYFANFHNPASTRLHPGNEGWRDKATQLEIDLVNRLRRETGLPVFVTGDMNEREEYYRKMTRGTDMSSADEGPNGRPPKRMAIDWIFGSSEVSFSGYRRDRGALVQETTDHPMIVSRARIDP